MTEGQEVVLNIGTSSSTCGACGKSCMPSEERHQMPCGYDQHAGCGARYTHVTTSYLDLGDRVRSMRPDLVFIGRPGVS